jgi:tetratricopeptide (TPR) repeat protein
MRAVDMLRRVVDLSPLDLNARQSLIDQLVFGGQNEQAIREYTKMADVYYSLAELADARKTYTKALRFVEGTGLGETWRVTILHKIADIDVQSLNWRQGLTIYERICGIFPDDLEANRNRIDLNFRLGDRNQALSAIEDFVKVLKRQNRLEDVVIFLEKLSGDWPQEAMIKSLLAEQYQEAGRTKEAIDNLDDARAILFDRGNHEGALVMLKRIIALNPENIEEYQQLLDGLQPN